MHAQVCLSWTTVCVLRDSIKVMTELNKKNYLTKKTPVKNTYEIFIILHYVTVSCHWDLEKNKKKGKQKQVVPQNATAAKWQHFWFHPDEKEDLQ